MEKVCQNRRQFLVKSTAATSGLILSLSGPEIVTAQENEPDDVTFKLDEKSPLNSIGGTLSFDYKGDKIIVLRKSESEFIAYSAFCPHQGGIVNFNPKTQQFVCPLHNSKFDQDGQRISGAARQALTSFPTHNAIVVSLKL